MSDPKPSRGPVAGGAILAICLFIGAIGGAALRQPTVGLIVGLIFGVAISLLIWRRDTPR